MHDVLIACWPWVARQWIGTRTVSVLCVLLKCDNEGGREGCGRGPVSGWWIMGEVLVSSRVWDHKKRSDVCSGVAANCVLLPEPHRDSACVSLSLCPVAACAVLSLLQSPCMITFYFLCCSSHLRLWFAFGCVCCVLCVLRRRGRRRRKERLSEERRR